MCKYYVGGHEHVVEIDPDKWSYFKATGIVKDITHLEHSQFWLWWYNSEADKYIRIVNDSDARVVFTYVVEMNFEVDIYVEHNGGINVEGGHNVEGF